MEDCIKFPNFDGPSAFFPSSTGPLPQLLKGRKIPDIDVVCINFIAFYLCKQFRCVNMLNIHVYAYTHFFPISLNIF